MVNPASDFLDDDFAEIAPGWQLGVVDHHLVATKSIEFDVDRKVDVRLALTPMSGTEIEALLERVGAAVTSTTSEAVRVPVAPSRARADTI